MVCVLVPVIPADFLCEGTGLMVLHGCCGQCEQQSPVISSQEFGGLWSDCSCRSHSTNTQD